MLSFLKKKWCLAEIANEKALALAKELNIPVTIAVLLINRGVMTGEEAKLYLQSDKALKF